MDESKTKSSEDKILRRDHGHSRVLRGTGVIANRHHRVIFRRGGS